MKYAAKTDKGLVRDTNEDCYDIVSGCPGITAAFIIADGMGGHNAGEIASRTAVGYISNALRESLSQASESSDFKDEKMSEKIENSIISANREIFNKSYECSENQGMGTTLTMAVISGDTMYVGHVGDSRLYLVRDKKISRITTDHSYIEELVKNGSLTREEAENHPQKNIITRALGLPGDVEVDSYEIKILDNDTFIICTDGLTNMVMESEIEKIASSGSPEDICEKLVSAANSRGGEDNITVIVINNSK